MKLNNLISTTTLCCSISLLAACSSSTSDTNSTASISGSIFASYVDGATVTITDSNGNDVADAGDTDASGSFSASFPSSHLSSDLIFQSSGGTFVDEATGNSTNAGDMAAYVPGGSLSTGSNVNATPGSTIVHQLITMYSLSVTEAVDAFTAAFGYTPDTSITPTDATNPATDADDAQKLDGLRAAAFSQLAADLGNLDLFDLIDALALDLSDGTLDGQSTSGAVMVGGTTALPVDIQNRFVTALLNFHNDGLMGDTHGNDQTGLNNAQIGMLPFAKVATTGLTAGAYKVEYIPGMMDAMQGKTEFTLRISDDSGNAVTGSTVELELLMSMSDRKHSTPDLDCEESIITAGDYYCTVYYVMASVMATGDSMGYWQIKATTDSKTAVFYPMVMMAMGDTTHALLKGIDPVDTISMMGLTQSRPYNLFRNKLSGSTGNHDFELFIAPMETMMSFPALATGLDLNSGALVVNDVKVEFSTDKTNWVEANLVGANGSGTWKITGLTGLTDGVEGNIYVKLSVDDDAGGLPGSFEPEELKTTNGLAADGGANDPSNEYTFFKVTP